ncbi:MAG: hydroxylamine reductase [Bacteroidales bacterium]|nr:hydroxylamine reductase [Bacteroidales bacterium]
MDNQMFCFQCQETAKGTGCTIAGVCGKTAHTSGKLDLLLFLTRGISVLSTSLREHKIHVPEEVDIFVCDALFTSITNANFNEEAIISKIKNGIAWREYLLDKAYEHKVAWPEVPETEWLVRLSDQDLTFCKIGVQRNTDEDIRSLKELITYGVKGMAAYLEHARHLGFTNQLLDTFIQRALSDISTKQMSVEDLLGLVLETGEHGVQAMALLDEANTTIYGNPEITEVSLEVGARPGILVSGHDLLDLDMLLEQSENADIDIYTHGEMLPAHYYPHLRSYPHLRGNYGSSWWHQHSDFTNFNGPILMTSNCIVPIREDAPYRDRIFTTNSAGHPGCPHIAADSTGRKNFSAIIRMAQRCEPPTPIDKGSLIGGFAHGQMEQLADRILQAVENGAIRKFVVMAGCDGRMRSREYYRDFARNLPEDCVILTAGCAKYRYNSLDLGDINGIPRVLDAGQCNDSYSLVLTAIMLRDALGLSDVNELPIVYNIAWYEQKAVIVLLALLALGIRNIHLGPTLPAFLSPNVLNTLVRKFSISGISNVDDDLRDWIR